MCIILLVDSLIGWVDDWITKTLTYLHILYLQTHKILQIIQKTIKLQDNIQNNTTIYTKHIHQSHKIRKTNTSIAQNTIITHKTCTNYNKNTKISRNHYKLLQFYNNITQNTANYSKLLQKLTPCNENVIKTCENDE